MNTDMNTEDEDRRLLAWVLSLQEWPEMLGIEPRIAKTVTVDTPLFQFNKPRTVPRNLVNAPSTRFPAGRFHYLEDQAVAPDGVIVYQVWTGVYVSFTSHSVKWYKLSTTRIKTLTTDLPNVIMRDFVHGGDLQAISRFVNFGSETEDFVTMLINVYCIWLTDARWMLYDDVGVNTNNRFGEIRLDDYTFINRMIYQIMRESGYGSVDHITAVTRFIGYLCYLEERYED